MEMTIENIRNFIEKLSKMGPDTCLMEQEGELLLTRDKPSGVDSQYTAKQVADLARDCLLSLMKGSESIEIRRNLIILLEEALNAYEQRSEPDGKRRLQPVQRLVHGALSGLLDAPVTNG